MLFTTHGDRAPRVVLVQVLLRGHGYDIPITGYYDPVTDAAVCDFRAQHHLAPHGPVNPSVFFHLIQGTDLKVIDSMDASAGATREFAEKDMQAAGVKPVLNPRVPRHGVERAVHQIIERAKGHRIALLRIHGHGNRGTWVCVAIGDPVHQEIAGKPANYETMKADFWSYIDFSHFAHVKPALQKLNPLFAPYASVELTSCLIGNNVPLMQRLADTWGVPVSGSTELHPCAGVTVNDYHEAVPNVFALTIPKAFYPHKGSLETWAASVNASIEVQIAGWMAKGRTRMAGAFGR